MTHLHVHSYFSILDGIGKPAEYVQRAKELGMKSIAITDHGNVDGAIKFQKACLEGDINPIFGCEFYIVENLFKKQKGEKRCHICIWAKDEIGWSNILKMLTIANVDGFYRRPRIDPQTLLNHCEGICVGTACTSTFLLEEWGMELFYSLKDKIKDDLYLEIMPLDFDAQKELNKKVIKLAKETSTKIIVTNDCHYVKDGDEIAQETMLAIQTKKKWTDPTRWKFEVSGLYLKSQREMLRSFMNQSIIDMSDFKEYVANTDELANKCNSFRIKEVKIELPRIPFLVRDKITDDDFLNKLVEEGFKEKIIDKGLDKELYKARVKEEMEIIHFKGFERYFLMVWEMIKWARDNDIEVGPGRGSSCSSLVCYLIGITRVNPIPFGLLFFRFISPTRFDLPDIDVDFANDRKDDVRQHLEDTYGKYNVAGISSFNFLKTRSVINDLARVFDLDSFYIREITKSVTGDLKELYTTPEGEFFLKKYPNEAKIADRLEGQIRSRGQHACGTVISKEDLRKGDKVILIPNKKDGRFMANWDKHDIEHQGLMKMDVLGLNEMTVIYQINKYIEEQQGERVDLDEIPLDDKKTLALLNSGKALGCFQLGTYGLRKFIKELGIKSFNDIVDATSLFRPGPLGNGSAQLFVERKHNREKVTYIHPIMEEITKETQGIIVYQEQIMLIVVKLAGLTWNDAEKMRKVIAKSQGEEALLPFKDKFVEGCVNNKTLSSEEATNLFEELVSFGKYSFAKSHAVAYSHITYWDAYFKVHYPYNFYRATLTYMSKGENREAKIESLLEDASMRGIEIRPVKRNISKATEWIEFNNVLYAPYSEIKGIGGNKAEKLETQKEKRVRKGFFFVPEKIGEKAKYKELVEETGASIDKPVDIIQSRQLEDFYGYRFPIFG